LELTTTFGSCQNKNKKNLTFIGLPVIMRAMRKTLGILLTGLGYLLVGIGSLSFIIVAIWGFFIEILIVYGLFGYWGVFVGLVIFPIVFAVIPFYALIASGNWFLLAFIYGGIPVAVLLCICGSLCICGRQIEKLGAMNI